MPLNDIETVIAMLGALGIGSVVTKATDAFLNRRKSGIDNDKAQIDSNFALRQEIRADLATARGRMDALDSQNEKLIIENAKFQGQVMVLAGQVETLKGETTTQAEEIKQLRQNAGASEARAQQLEREMVKLNEQMSRMQDENFALATKINILHDENRLLRSTLDRNGITAPELNRVTDPRPG